MGYANRNDGKGWRSVSGPKEVLDNETYSESQPGPIMPTPQELRAAELAALFSTYQSDTQALQSAWVSALIADGEAETNRKAAVAEEIAEVRIQYASDVAAVKSKYNEV